MNYDQCEPGLKSGDAQQISSVLQCNFLNDKATISS
jgi:hypothetical protein